MICDKGFISIMHAIAKVTIATEEGETTQPFFLDFTNNVISIKSMLKISNLLDKIFPRVKKGTSIG